MKIICLFRRLPGWLMKAVVAATLCILTGLLSQTEAANLPVPPTATGQTTTAVSTANPAASPSAPEATATQPAPQVGAPHLQLPMAFADFAADYHPQVLHPDWLTVQVGTMETIFAPPQGKAMFVLPQLPQSLADIFQPTEISCLLGAKSRFENVTQIDVDPLGHSLGYSLPMGKIVYVLARAELSQGISLSLHYYEAAQLRWLPNPEKDGWFIPVTLATSVSQDLLAPADGFVFMFLSNRVGPPHPDSTAQPVELYTYLVLHVHIVPQPAPALPVPPNATSSP